MHKLPRPLGRGLSKNLVGFSQNSCGKIEKYTDKNSINYSKIQIFCW